MVGGADFNGMTVMGSSSISKRSMLGVPVDGLGIREEVISWDFFCFLDEDSLLEEPDLFFKTDLVDS